MSPTSLSQAACSNARVLLARVIRSFRRTGDFAAARAIIRNARTLGTYPPPPHSRTAFAPLRREEAPVVASWGALLLH
jgi:hypothetical protein